MTAAARHVQALVQSLTTYPTHYASHHCTACLPSVTVLISTLLCSASLSHSGSVCVFPVSTLMTRTDLSSFRHTCT